MGTLGIIPPQYSQPGNLSNLPDNVTSTLDPNKLKQLSPAQLDIIKTFPVERLAVLNNIPIDKIKKLDPKKLKNFIDNLPNAKDAKNKLDKIQKQIKDRKDKEKEKFDNFKKSLNDKKDFLKETLRQTAQQARQGVASKDNKRKLALIAIPILLQFIRAENIADILIKKLTKDTKKQLQNKGTLVIDNGVFTFTPSDSGNYNVFKKNFDRRVENIKKAISTLNNIVNITNNIVKMLNIALSLILLYIKIKQKLLLVKLTKITAELSTPIPAKPTVGLDLLTIINNLQQTENDKKKVEDFQSIVVSLQLFLTIFREMIFKLNVKIRNLQFNINESPNNDATSLNSQLDDSGVSVPNEEEYISSNGKSYILKLVTLPNEQRQCQALDSFSKMKITQTAPSITKTNAELFDEIKQILG